MHHTHQCPDHVPHSITFTDNEPVQVTSRAKSLVEIARLHDTVCANERLPTMKILLGLANLANFSNNDISRWSLCHRPAMSMSTMLNLLTAP